MAEQGAASLADELDRLREAGAAATDPLNFFYAQSLLCRAGRGDGPQSEALCTKARAALAQARQSLEPEGDDNDAAAPPPLPCQLSELTSLLDERARNTTDKGGALDNLLRQQESELLGAVGAGSGPTRVELKAVREMRSAAVRTNADQLVTLAVAEIPEHCGPLNPQRLATRSLSAMRDLSPHYLNRFVSFVDTLFWLEQADRETPKS